MQVPRNSRLGNRTGGPRQRHDRPERIPQDDVAGVAAIGRRWIEPGGTSFEAPIHRGHHILDADVTQPVARHAASRRARGQRRYIDAVAPEIVATHTAIEIARTIDIERPELVAAKPTGHGLQAYQQSRWLSAGEG